MADDTLESLRAELDASDDRPEAEGGALRTPSSRDPDLGAFGKTMQAWRKTAQDAAMERAMSAEWLTQAKKGADGAEAALAEHRDALEHPESPLGPEALKAAHAAAEVRHAQAQGFLGAVQQYEAARLVRNLDQSAPTVGAGDEDNPLAPWNEGGPADPFGLGDPRIDWRRQGTALYEAPKAAAHEAASGLFAQPLSGAGRMIEGGAGTAGRAIAQRSLEAAGQNLQLFLRQQLSIMDRIDAGQPVMPMQDAMGYADMAPGGPERARARQELEHELSVSNPSPAGSGLIAAGKAAGEVGAKVGEAVGKPVGKAIREYGGEPIQALIDKLIPLDPTIADHPVVKMASMAGGFLPYVAVTALAGQPGAVALAGLQSYEATYKQAKAHGASDQDAHEAAAIAAMGNGLLMGKSVTHWMEGLPALFKGPMIVTAGTMATQGVFMTSVMQAQKVLDNVIAKNYYDPERNPWEGVGTDLPETFGVAAMFPAGMHGVHAVPGMLRDRAATRKAEADKANPTAEPPTLEPAKAQEQALREELELEHALLTQLSTIRTPQAGTKREEKRQ